MLCTELLLGLNYFARSWQDRISLAIHETMENWCMSADTVIETRFVSGRWMIAKMPVAFSGGHASDIVWISVGKLINHMVLFNVAEQRGELIMPPMLTMLKCDLSPFRTLSSFPVYKVDSSIIGFTHKHTSHAEDKNVLSKLVDAPGLYSSTACSHNNSA